MSAGIVSRRVSVARSAWRIDVTPSGAVNGINTVFQTPDNFLHLTPNGLTVMPHVNGIRLTESGDYSVSESGGLGTGFDTVTFVCAPKTGHIVRFDYVKA